MSVFAGDACTQVARALEAANWPRFLVPIMVAISKAESGCDPNATNATIREYSVGPFQINLKAHPDVTESCARDAWCAAKAAFSIYQSSGLKAWTTFRTGAYRRFLPSGTPVPGTAIPSGTGSPFADVPAQASLPWARPAIVGAALLLILMGIAAWRGGKVM